MSLEEKNIQMCPTQTIDKSVFDERFVGSQRNRIYRYMTSTSKNLYINKLEDMVKKCNNTSLHNKSEAKNVTYSLIPLSLTKYLQSDWSRRVQC